MKPDGYEAAVTLAGRATPRLAGRVWPGPTALYEREKRKRGLVDFDDLITGCADVLGRDPEFAAAQRWRFRHLFVDERTPAPGLSAAGGLGVTAATCAWSAISTRRSTDSPAPTRRTSAVPPRFPAGALP